MKKLNLTLLMLTYLGFTLAQGTGYIHLNGRQFIDKNGSPFFPMVINYHVNIVHNQPGPNPQYKIVRSFDYGTDKCALEGGYSFADCENSLINDFARISQMGYNTVRIIGDLTPFRKGNGVLGFQKWSGIYNFGTNTGTFCGPNSRRYFNLDPPYTNSDCATYFNLIGHFLDIADQYNMKVIFLVTDGSGCAYNGQGGYICSTDRGSSLAEAMDYASYLRELAKIIKAKPALLAYDLYNEPIWQVFQPGRNMDKDKKTVCEYVSLWYDAIKAEDQNHLITLGGSDFNDIFYWDTGVMKLDFVSIHIYPHKDDYGIFPPNSPILRESIINQFYWFTETLGKPWIIGETGFSASDELCLSNVIWGNETDQSNFMAGILPAVRDCYGSGFSWWLFQDINWYCFSDNSCYPACNVCTKCAPTNISGNIVQDYFGLQKYSDPDPITGQYSSLDLKAAAQVSMDFDEGNGFPTVAPCIAPTPFYYDPSQFSTLNLNAGSYINGRVENQEGNAISKAAILALNWLYTYDPTPGGTPNDEEYHHIWIHTYTNDNTSGNNFTIVPYSPFNPNDPRIVAIKVSTVGASKAELGDPWPYEDVALNTNVGNITLNRIIFNYDTQLINTTISSNSVQKSYRGWNSLNVTNSTINSGVTSELVARNEININPNFTAENGSDVHIYLDETFADCNDYNGFLRVTKPVTIVSNDNNLSNQHQLKLVFKKTISNIEIGPNPSSGRYRIIIDSAIEIKNMNLVIRNTIGQVLLKKEFDGFEYEIDLSDFINGIYFLELFVDEQKFNEKLIKN